jgi:hypothetical protein
MSEQGPQEPAGRKKCPECAGEMGPIYLIDRGHGNNHREMEYAVEEGGWLFRLPAEGKVHAFICVECGRILLYGHPHHVYEPPTGPIGLPPFV